MSKDTSYHDKRQILHPNIYKFNLKAYMSFCIHERYTSIAALLPSRKGDIVAKTSKELFH
jgi:hypothetical protein